MKHHSRIRFLDNEHVLKQVGLSYYMAFVLAYIIHKTQELYIMMFSIQIDFFVQIVNSIFALFFILILKSDFFLKGWDSGVIGMKKGLKRLLVIPPSLAYGAKV